MEKIKLLLADDRELFREGLARLLESQPGIGVVCQCDDGLKAVKKARETEPDVVLMDINVAGPGCDGLEATQRINESLPNTKVAVLTDSENEERFFSALKAGAKGYLLKNIGVDDLTKSIDLIAKGEVIVSPPLSRKLLSKFTHMKEENGARKAESKKGLSSRENQVLKLVAQGDTNKEIAERLIITENTVKVHMKNILEKLELRNKQQAAVYAVQQGLATSVEDTGEKPV